MAQIRNRNTSYELVLKPSAQKELEALSDVMRVRIEREFGALIKNPFLGKKLAGRLDGLFSVRVWPCRVLYFLVRSRLIIIIIAIRHRKDAYRA